VAEIHAITSKEPALVRGILAQGGTLLAEFAGVGNEQGALCLLDLGVPANALYIGDGYFGIAKDSTALHVAAWRGESKTVKVLLSRGAPVSVFDGEGRTPLQRAVLACTDSYWKQRRSPEWVAPLLEAGATLDGIEIPCGYPEADELLIGAQTRTNSGSEPSSLSTL